MQAGEQREPGDEDERKQAPWWHDPRVPPAAVVLILLLLAFGAWQAIRAGIAEDRRAMLEARAAEGFLMPPSTTRTARVSLRAPRRVSLGGGQAAERLEILIEARSDRYQVYRIAISRDDGTSVMHVDRVQPDSSGNLRIALNSTLLPPGSYSIRVDGFTWRGETAQVGSIPLVVPAR